jgi:hypothetical protein
MHNLNLIENQPRWRVAIVSRFAQLMGVMVHVEGFPFGSSRTLQKGKQASGSMGEEAGAPGEQAAR